MPSRDLAEVMAAMRKGRAGRTLGVRARDVIDAGRNHGGAAKRMSLGQMGVDIRNLHVQRDVTGRTFLAADAGDAARGGGTMP